MSPVIGLFAGRRRHFPGSAMLGRYERQAVEWASIDETHAKCYSSVHISEL